MYKQPLPIYPSQLSDFKIKAKKFASIIEGLSGLKALSSFQRNDWLAQSLGYTGHSGLVNIANSRKSTDKNTQLIIFSKNRHFADNIISIYSNKLPAINPLHIQSAIQIMATDEKKENFKLQERLNSSNKILPITVHSTLTAITNSLDEKYGSVMTGIWLLGLYSGLRMSELLSIKMSDISEDTIIIHQHPYKTDRRIKLSSIGKDIIQKIKKDNPGYHFLFQSRINGRNSSIHPLTVIKAFKKISLDLGIKFPTETMQASYSYNYYLELDKRNNSYLMNTQM